MEGIFGRDIDPCLQLGHEARHIGEVRTVGHGENPLLRDQGAAAEMLVLVLERGQPGEAAQGRLTAVVHLGLALSEL